MSSSSLLIVVVVMMGAMFMMTRSAKKKQQTAAEMRNKLEPGSGVRTIGGMYALVKAVNDDSVELEVAPGVHAIYSKTAIAVVLDGAEYNRIVHGDTDDEVEGDDEVEDVTADEAATSVELDKAPSLDDVPSLEKSVGTPEAEAADKADAVAAESAADKGVSAK
jgi:preprotein translocase subunit YajC